MHDLGLDVVALFVHHDYFSVELLAEGLSERRHTMNMFDCFL